MLPVAADLKIFGCVTSYIKCHDNLAAVYP
jgi:hypothetical protein